MKPMSRRKFLINSAVGMAGIGLIAGGCDKRFASGPDIRSPAAPKGLEYQLTNDADSTSVIITWAANDLTDITGAKTETRIQGYNIYRDGQKIGSNVDGTRFVDSNGVQQLQEYQYTLTAIDASGNESPHSDPLLVAIQKASEVFQVTDPSVLTGTVIDLEKVKKMLAAALMRMTGQSTESSAWESLFPGLSAATLIGIKVNTLGGGNVSTKPAVVEAIVSGLTQMLGGTFQAHNIIVFDDRNKDDQMKRAGYILRDDPDKYRIACTKWNTTLHNVPVNKQESTSDLWGTTLDVGGIPQKLSAIFEGVDYIINVPVLKDHSLSGITFSMKNFYGIIDNPSALHANMCSPLIPDLYNQQVNGSPLRNKVKLIVGDALIGCCVGGPDGAANMTPCTLVVGTDPVAMDTWALQRINRERLSHNEQSISSGPTGNARYILTASLPPYSIGSTNCVTREVVIT